MTLDNGTDGQTDRRTDRQSATQYAAPPREEGRIIIAILYASCAWWGFTTAADRQRLESFLRRARRSGFYSDDQPTLHCVHKLSKSQKVDLRKSPLKLWTCKRLKFN